MSYKSACAALVLVFLAACADDRLPGEAVITESLERAAVEAQQTGDYVAALSHFRRLHERLPADRDILLGLARNLRYVGAAREAVGLLEDYKRDHADDAKVLVELGKARLAASETADAIEQLKAALEKDPGNWEIYSALGIAYDLMQSHDAAQEAYRKALELSRDNPTVLNNMALSAALSGDLENAVAILQRVAPMARQNPQIRQNLALFYGIKGEFGKAEALAKMDLDDDTVRNNLAFYYRFRDSSPPAKPK